MTCPFPVLTSGDGGGIDARQIALMLERPSKATDAELLSLTNLPEPFDWTAEIDTLADSVFQGPEDGQLHLCESPVPEALVTDSLGRPIWRASISCPSSRPA